MEQTVPHPGLSWYANELPHELPFTSLGKKKKRGIVSTTFTSLEPQGSSNILCINMLIAFPLTLYVGDPVKWNPRLIIRW